MGCCGKKDKKDGQKKKETLKAVRWYGDLTDKERTECQKAVNQVSTGQRRGSLKHLGEFDYFSDDQNIDYQFPGILPDDLEFHSFPEILITEQTYLQRINNFQNYYENIEKSKHLQNQFEELKKKDVISRKEFDKAMMDAYNEVDTDIDPARILPFETEYFHQELSNIVLKNLNIGTCPPYGYVVPEPEYVVDPEPVDPKHAVDPEPVVPKPEYVDPEPEYVDPKPVDPEHAVDPELVVPKPEYVDPEPEYVDPKPVDPEHAVDPELVVPKPEYVDPKPEYVDPEPVDPEHAVDPELVVPKPEYFDPEPEYVDPKPEYVDPKPVDCEPEPLYPEPLNPEPEYDVDCEPEPPEPLYPEPLNPEPLSPEPKYVDPKPVPKPPSKLITPKIICEENVLSYQLRHKKNKESVRNENKFVTFFWPQRTEEICAKSGLKYVTIGGSSKSNRISKTKTIVLLGAPESGKTSYLNILINYLFDVRESDSFRFIVEAPVNHQNYVKSPYPRESSNHTNFQPLKTKHSIIYNFNNTILGYRLRVIDTPGLDSKFSAKNLYHSLFRPLIQHRKQFTIDRINIMIKENGELGNGAAVNFAYQLQKIKKLFGKGMNEGIVTPIVTSVFEHYYMTDKHNVTTLKKSNNVWRYPVDKLRCTILDDLQIRHDDVYVHHYNSYMDKMENSHIRNRSFDAEAHAENQFAFYFESLDENETSIMLKPKSS